MICKHCLKNDTEQYNFLPLVLSVKCLIADWMAKQEGWRLSPSHSVLSNGYLKIISFWLVQEADYLPQNSVSLNGVWSQGFTNFLKI
jgi:hypothetical protein